ncbi:MAG: hint domain-containing protein [Magnetococcales bacterium]|nr:hint domain-containing protein [Magnetococcales bacterium]
MTTYLQYAQQLAQELISAPPSGISLSGLTDSNVNSQLTALINAFPYFGDTDWNSAHRGALSNLLQVNLPNNGIAPHPDESGPWYAYYRSTYSYNGSASGYANAFFPGAVLSASGSRVASEVAAVNAGMNGSWWGGYAVPVLTDAIRAQVSVGVDANKLTTALGNYHSALMPALAASYLGTFKAGFNPTAQAWSSLVNSGNSSAAATLLDQKISSGQFTANINQSIAMGGDSSNAATWFLFNLWIALKALGWSDVDGAISRYKAAGMSIPGQVDAVKWWNGGYISWYSPLSGADLPSSTITASMPESELTSYTGSYMPSHSSVNEADGYSHSFCEWGSLALYKPDSGSCFGGETRVLMADGRVRRIAEVRIGDMVQTAGGPRVVVMIETPKRAGRKLYSVNGQQVFTTATHPFRRGAEGGPLRYAVSPWGLIDGIPDMASQGEGVLKAGVVLAGMRDGRSAALTVQRVEEYESSDPQEVVYDLLLNDWENGHGLYYVGGPESFFVVEAETANPLSHPEVTTAVIAAMEMSHGSCREHLGEPHVEIPKVVGKLDAQRIARQARKAVRPYLGGKPMPPTPDTRPTFCRLNGEWNAHSSMLEYYLVGRFGRWLRSEIANGWRCHGSGVAGDHLAVGLFDIEFVGDPAPEPGRDVEVELDLEGVFRHGETASVSLSVAVKPESAWRLVIDRTLDLGRVGELPSRTMLLGAIRQGGQLLGSFRCAVSGGESGRGRGDHFIFHPNGRIIGRICLDQRLLCTRELQEEETAAQRWRQDPGAAQALAVVLGRQIGLHLLSEIEAHSSVGLAK